nr:phospholipase-like, aminotransferase-like mobile domain protein [Tanacetum cinerariifolium]
MLLPGLSYLKIHQHKWFARVAPFRDELQRGHNLHFGRPEFALITGLPFGIVNFRLYTFGELKFRNRVFPHKLGLSVTNLDVIEDEETFRKLCDQDSIRLCLILALDVKFMGRLLTCPVDDTLFQLIKNLEDWNCFPWGGHIWTHLYDEIKNVIEKHSDEHYFGMKKDRMFGSLSHLKDVIVDGLKIQKLYQEHLEFTTTTDIRPTIAEYESSWWICNHVFFGDDEKATNPPPVPPTPQAPHTLSTIKLPILKKVEYDIWAIKMKHYLGHTDYPIWEVIQKGNGHVQVSIDTHGQIRVLPPKTAEEILASKRERKERTTLLMAIPDDHFAKFHKITYAKEMTKPGVYTFSFDDLYNNLRVFESDVKGSTTLSFSTQNVAFVSSDSNNSTNEVSTAYGISTSSGHNSQKEGSSSHTDELMYSFFANQSSGPKLDHEDLEQVDEFNLERIDLKWQVAMIFTRLKKFYKKRCRKLSKGNQESRRRDAGNTGYKARDNGRRPAKQDEHKAMVTIDGEGIDWTVHTKADTENYALMAFNSSNSCSDTEITFYSKECEKTYTRLKKLYDEQREQLGDVIYVKSYIIFLSKLA